MGKQLPIAQSPVDEQDFVEWLKSEYDVVTLPKYNRSIPDSYQELGDCKAPEQSVFLRSLWPEICEAFITLEDGSGDIIVHPETGWRFCIEWCRTEQDGGDYIVGRSGDSRFWSAYLPGEDTKETRALFDGIVRWIKSASPGTTNTPLARQIGPDLFVHLTQHQQKLFYRSGIEILVEAKDKKG